VVHNGRVWEAGVALKSGLSRGLGTLLGLSPMALGLVRRGRMPLRRTRIRGASEVTALARAVARRSPAAQGTSEEVWQA